MKQKHTGFSLMELTITLALGSILAAVLIPSFHTQIQKAHTLTEQMQGINKELKQHNTMFHN